MIGIKEDLFLWFISFLVKSPHVVVLMNNQLKNCTNQLFETLKKTVHSGFKYNIWCADLTNVQLISRFNKGFKFLWCVINVFSKYAWIVPLKDKKGITITNSFKIKLEESNRKPNKIWVGKVSEFYNTSFLKMV